ncbi:MAG: hypothetical protein HDR99_07410 [Bacteroides sp.]|nr:hypothetical protein [Bacteroides sp.]
MRRKVFILAILSLLSAPKLPAKDFFIGLTSHSSNFWMSPGQLPVWLINNLLLGGGSSSMGYDWVSITPTNGAQVSVQNGKLFGFKARDLFNNFGIGAQITYQPRFSIFGAWVNGGYKYRQFGMDLNMAEQEKTRYYVNAWYAGVGVRLTPFQRLLENKGWSPFIDFGTSYNTTFSESAPFNSDSDQFGKGLALSFGLGVRMCKNYNEKGVNISIVATVPQYDYFNREFEIDGGIKPYQDIKSRNYSIFLKLQQEF